MPAGSAAGILLAREFRGKRHGDPPWLEDPGRHLGQQRQVEEVVGQVDDDDVGATARKPGQLPGGAETGETGTDDDDMRTRHCRHYTGKRDSRRTSHRVRAPNRASVK